MTVTHTFGDVALTMPDNFADSLKQPAPVVNVEAPNITVAAPNVTVAAPVINLPEKFGQTTVPAPTVTVNVPPQTVTVNAEVVMPDTDTVTEIELDKQSQRIKRTRASTRKVQ